MKLILSILLITHLALQMILANQSTMAEFEKQIHVPLEQQLKQERWELVMFWATYCGPCKRDFKKLGAFIRDNPELPFTIVGVVTDGIEESEKTHAIVDKHDLNYYHLLTNHQAANHFYQGVVKKKLIGTPSYILYNTDNKPVLFHSNAIDIEALELFIDE